jgi:hypothetical protein
MFKFDKLSEEFREFVMEMIKCGSRCYTLSIGCKNCPFFNNESKGEGCLSQLIFKHTDNYFERKLLLCEDYIHQLNNKLIDDHFKKKGIPIEEKYRIRIEKLKEQGECGECGECQFCPFSIINNKTKTYCEYATPKRSIPAATRYLELLDEIKLLDLTKIEFYSVSEEFRERALEIINNNGDCGDLACSKCPLRYKNNECSYVIQVNISNKFLLATDAKIAFAKEYIRRLDELKLVKIDLKTVIYERIIKIAERIIQQGCCDGIDCSQCPLSGTGCGNEEGEKIFLAKELICRLSEKNIETSDMVLNLKKLMENKDLLKQIFLLAKKGVSVDELKFTHYTDGEYFIRIINQKNIYLEITDNGDVYCGIGNPNSAIGNEAYPVRNIVKIHKLLSPYWIK